MNFLKRLTTSVTATLESAAGQLENHDAIVQATIKETRQSVAKTKARINTLRQQQAVYETQLTDAAEQTQKWESRAQELAEADEDKALQCLSRRNQYQHEQSRLQDSISQQASLITKVETNLRTLQSRLEEMQHKHNLLRSRQSVADANKGLAKSSSDQDLADTFERWESVVLEHELGCDDALGADPLQQEFEQRESKAELRAQLESLKKQ
jgi:phage shock protein A